MIPKTTAKDKITYDLDLTNQVYTANLASLISLSKDNIETINQREDDFLKEMEEWDYNEHPVPDNYFHHKSSDLMHLDWLLLNSIFIASFSFFEHHLQSLASIVEDRVTSDIKVNDISGKNYIGQYRKYLDLVGHLKSAQAKNEEWGTIGQYQGVRNKLVHKGGILKTDLQKPLQDQSGYTLLDKYKVIMAGSLGLIRIKNTDIIEAFGILTTDLSDKLVNEIRTKYPDNKKTTAPNKG